jgi:hypothetical protein
LEQEYELDLAGWSLDRFVGISDDRRLLLARAQPADEEDPSEYWRIDLSEPLPEPETSLLGVAALISLAAIRRA